MNYINFAKKNLTNIPYPVGKLISNIPYEYRPGIGKVYKERKSEIYSDLIYNEIFYKEKIFNRTKNIATYAYKNIPFYRDLYNRNDVNPERMTCFEDIQRLPIISKSNLQDVSLEYRSNTKIKSNLVNTGGSSGQPLSLYIQPSSIPHEWAHMHMIWKKLGYKQNDLKVVFGGRADIKNVIAYDAVRHQLTIDIYKSPRNIADSLFAIFNKYKPKYLHGYPSAIFDFVVWLDLNEHPLLKLFKDNIKGMFLGSEYPSPQLREKVEQLLNCKSVSWYGHTERAILAYEKNDNYIYSPFISYGFAEAVDKNQDQLYELIGTSYYNFASPLIRYNSNDLIEPELVCGLLTNFKVSQGRNGEYVTDLNGNKIYLTALIFGRHHEIFNYAKHVQVSQNVLGSIKLYITTDINYSKEFVLSKLDLTNLQLHCTVEIVSYPITTTAGKVPLLIKE